MKFWSVVIFLCVLGLGGLLAWANESLTKATDRAIWERDRANVCERALNVLATEGAKVATDRFVYRTSQGRAWLVDVGESCDAGTCLPMVRVTGEIR